MGRYDRLCAAWASWSCFERLVRLRRRKIVPAAFTARFLDRLHEGKLDCGQALDHCELNPSPAARVALAAVRRWGRPAADLERAVALAHRVETDELRRNVGTLRRIAMLAPLLGLLGTLFACGRDARGRRPRSRPRGDGHRDIGTRLANAGSRGDRRLLATSDAAVHRHHRRHPGLGRLRRIARSASRSWPASSTGWGQRPSTPSP